MSVQPTIAALGLVDERGIVGSSGVSAEWSALGVEPPGTGRLLRHLFDKADPTFRRLSPLARVLVLATEAAGLARCLPARARDETAIVIETETGSLAADRRFLDSLGRGFVEGALFPYTLASTSLGEVAIRHGLRGPTLCLSVGPEGTGEALREARHLLADGDACFALAGSIEVFGDPAAGGKLRAVVALVAHPRERVRPVAAFEPESSRPFDALAAAARG